MIKIYKKNVGKTENQNEKNEELCIELVNGIKMRIVIVIEHDEKRWPQTWLKNG